MANKVLVIAGISAIMAGIFSYFAGNQILTSGTEKWNDVWSLLVILTGVGFLVAGIFKKK